MQIKSYKIKFFMENSQKNSGTIYEHSHVVRFKARLVAQGFTQVAKASHKFQAKTLTIPLPQ